MSKNKKSNDTNGFWDRLQDFLYDSIDYILMIIVVAVVALIINWRLGGLFGDTKIVKDDIKNKKEQVETTVDKKEDKKNKDAKKEKESSKKDDNKKEQDDKEKEKKKDEKTGKIIKLSIPKGSASQTICDILLENKLIDDKKDFMKYIEEKQVETKLKYGNYDIPEGSSYDEIIEILTK